ncbi:MAG: DegT/DnrJ/EryC1/StrS family aminotransferase [Chlorobi bacterium]|nr:DegT/DnrJ/EryC1/StrS family aminotransferase [Chlorobiota bacterium]
MIPLLDLHRQYTTIGAAIEERLLNVARSQRFVLGPETDRLEQSLAEYLSVRHAIAVSSGTDALLVSLMALGIGPRDEVIVPTFSFFATAGVVARVHAKPVFVDVEPRTLTLDVAATRKAITPRTRAIIPVHLYGQGAAMDELLTLANEAGIPIIEDAAQALGAYHRDGRRLGTIGHVGCYSFYPTKNLGAFGDAGLVVTNDDEIAHRIRIMRNHGMEPRYYHSVVGGNFRIDEFQAAVLNVKLAYLDQWNAARREHATLYRRLFCDRGLVGQAMELLDERYPNIPYTHIYHQFVVLVRDRDRLRSWLGARGIGTEVYYPVPFHRQECFRWLGYCAEDFPIAEDACARVLALPMFAELHREEITAVVEAITEFYTT